MCDLSRIDQECEEPLGMFGEPEWHIEMRAAAAKQDLRTAADWLALYEAGEADWEFIPVEYQGWVDQQLT